MLLPAIHAAPVERRRRARYLFALLTLLAMNFASEWLMSAWGWTISVSALALVVAVASAHRAEAFETCRAVVEEIKAEVPIWKRQHTAAGHAHWVGLP